MFLRSGQEKITYTPRKDSGNKRRMTPTTATTTSTKSSKVNHEELLSKEAKKAAPVLFAKPGDLFEWTDYQGDSTVVEYIGRNTIPSKKIKLGDDDDDDDDDETYTSPKKGWLIFHEHESSECTIDVTSGGIRDAVGAWPIDSYSQYDGEGKVEDTLCIPPEMCGALKVARSYNEDKESDKKTEEEEEVIEVSQKLLREAKRAVPVLFANKGDRFEWSPASQYESEEPCVVKYVGRNERTSENPGPKAGWLVFRNDDSRSNQIDAQNGGIRDAISAWPIDKYSHYNDEGKRIRGRLCIPVEKCGVLNVYKEPKLDDDYGGFYRW